MLGLSLHIKQKLSTPLLWDPNDMPFSFLEGCRDEIQKNNTVKKNLTPIYFHQ